MFADQSRDIAQLEQRANSGARWFYWIAALSLITSLIMLSGSNWRFILSLGTTQLITDIAKATSRDLGNVGTAIAVVFDLLAAGLFAGLGVLAGKRYLGAFVAGMILFGLDALVLILSQDWIGIIFHVLVLYWIFTGFNACRLLLTLQREAAQNYAVNLVSGAGTTPPPAQSAPPAP
ncbi:MAG TPA: hypothetical protein VN920_15475 [Pyrinomonadaceae bacterium]|nr:hypothetical protein [Pyrinomonadaceae bacterium]